MDPRVRHYAFDKPRLRQPLRQLRSVQQIKHNIDAFAPDVVHFQQGHLWFNTALRSLMRYPLVVTIHDPRYHAGDKVSQKTPQWVMDYGFRCADHAIVHGEALALQVHQLFGIPNDNIHVIPHVAMGSVGDVVIDEEPGNILFFGRIWDYKGLEYLIRAEPLIAKEVSEFKIVIGGEGEDFGKYRNMIGDSPRFEIHNRWIDDAERAEFFQRASIVVLPYKEATQSGVVPVAYTYSRPVVATRVGALAECVFHNETGLLVEPEDPQDLANAIIKLLKDAQLRKQMGAAGHRRMQNESSPAVVARQTVQAYQAAIEGRLQMATT
ncbi:MAG: glycosyltransferase family 4 protein [Pirellulaceae bacterium]